MGFEYYAYLVFPGAFGTWKFIILGVEKDMYVWIDDRNITHNLTAVSLLLYKVLPYCNVEIDSDEVNFIIIIYTLLTLTLITPQWEVILIVKSNKKKYKWDLNYLYIFVLFIFHVG